MSTGGALAQHVHPKLWRLWALITPINLDFAPLTWKARFMKAIKAITSIRLSSNRLPLLILCVVVLANLTIGARPARAQMASDSLLQYIERTEELLLWARGLVTETGSEPARKVLVQAAELHQRSRTMMERGLMRESLAVARRARDAMWHAVRVARESMGLEERLRIRAERFSDQHSNLMARARDARHQQALGFLERARQQADRARDIYHEGDFKLAAKMLEQAENLMHRAARLLVDSGGPEHLEQEFERVQQVIDQMRNRLGNDVTPRQHELLAEAAEALQRALTAKDQDRPGRALQMLGLAGSLARRAAPGAPGEPNEEAFTRHLERFEERADRLGDRVRESGSSRALQMFERALDQRKRAVSAHGDGKLELALRQLRAAHDLLTQTADLIP